MCELTQHLHDSGLQDLPALRHGQCLSLQLPAGHMQCSFGGREEVSSATATGVAGAAVVFVPVVVAGAAEDDAKTVSWFLLLGHVVLLCPTPRQSEQGIPEVDSCGSKGS